MCSINLLLSHSAIHLLSRLSVIVKSVLLQVKLVSTSEACGSMFFILLKLTTADRRDPW